MTEIATKLTTGERAPWPPEEFVAQLRAQGTRYHNLHPVPQADGRRRAHA